MAPPDHHLPAILKPGQLVATADTHLVPALIADAGEPTAWRYIEFFTDNIRNPNICAGLPAIFCLCENHGLTLASIRPFDVSTYIETLRQTHSAPAVSGKNLDRDHIRTQAITQAILQKLTKK